MSTVISGVQYSGMWTLDQATNAKAAGTWPVAPQAGSGQLFTWGSGNKGQLGTSSTVTVSSPVQVGTSTSWLQSAAGFYHKAAIKDALTGSPGGTLWTWGYNNNGQLGLNSAVYGTSSPTQVGALTNWLQVSCGQYTTMAVKTDGTLWAWGSNNNGQLGLNSATASFSSPTQVGALTNWLYVAASGYSGYGLKTDGTIWSWGAGSVGRLGLGNLTYYSSPKQIGALTNWTAIGAMAGGAFAINSSGELYSWGSNSNGQLGINSVVNQSSPSLVGSGWSKIILRADRSIFAIKTNGTLWAWGRNSTSQLGIGTTAYKSSPTQIGALTNWSAVAAGNSGTVAVKTDGTLWGWGANIFSGSGEVAVPTQIGALTTWLSVSAGFYSAAANKPA